MAEDFSAIATVVLPVGDGEQRAAAAALVHLRVVGPLATALTGQFHLIKSYITNQQMLPGLNNVLGKCFFTPTKREE